MPFFARDESKNALVIVASKRSKRPRVFGKKKICPFDFGNEKLTPPTRLALPDEKNYHQGNHQKQIMKIKIRLNNKK